MSLKLPHDYYPIPGIHQHVPCGGELFSPEIYVKQLDVRSQLPHSEFPHELVHESKTCLYIVAEQAYNNARQYPCGAYYHSVTDHERDIHHESYIISYKGSLYRVNFKLDLDKYEDESVSMANEHLLNPNDEIPLIEYVPKVKTIKIEYLGPKDESIVL